MVLSCSVMFCHVLSRFVKFCQDVSSCGIISRMATYGVIGCHREPLGTNGSQKKPLGAAGSHKVQLEAKGSKREPSYLG